MVVALLEWRIWFCLHILHVFIVSRSDGFFFDQGGLANFGFIAELVRSGLPISIHSDLGWSPDPLHHFFFGKMVCFSDHCLWRLWASTGDFPAVTSTMFLGSDMIGRYIGSIELRSWRVAGECISKKVSIFLKDLCVIFSTRMVL